MGSRVSAVLNHASRTANINTTTLLKTAFCLIKTYLSFTTQGGKRKKPVSVLRLMPFTKHFIKFYKACLIFKASVMQPNGAGQE